MAGAREFDIIVWGATGFVGRRVVEYLANRAGAMRWAIGGRNPARLEAVRAGLGQAAKDLAIVTGEAHDGVSLEALAARARVVCTTVGPYARHGSDLVAACARSGTHYCDLAADIPWIRAMIDAHQGAAAQSGARIVHACGFDSIPSDVGVFFLQREATARRGRPCRHVGLRVKELRSGFSGGTVGSFLDAAEENARDPAIARFLAEPYGLNPDGARDGPDPPDSMTALAVVYDKDLKSWTRPFVMEPKNTRIVRRTNAIAGYPYGQGFRYDEAVLTGDGPFGWLRATAGATAQAAVVRAATLAPVRRLLALVLPPPGKGPSERARARGRFDFRLIGTWDDGQTLRARVSAAGDPATESTARMLAEAALCLADDADRITVGGGFWTPAAAMGDLLLPRLTAYAGLRFTVD